jgi:alpha-beta hydrolase superfamily lysophospholipase
LVLKANGDAGLAVRILNQLVERDPTLLAALTRPYLPGILQHAIDRTMKRAGMARRATPKAPAKTKPRELPAAQLDHILDKLGAEFGSARTTTLGAPKTATEVLARVGIGVAGDPPPTKAGEKHQKAMSALAQSFNFAPGGSNAKGPRP